MDAAWLREANAAVDACEGMAEQSGPMTEMWQVDHCSITIVESNKGHIRPSEWRACVYAPAPQEPDCSPRIVGDGEYYSRAIKGVEALLPAPFCAPCPCPSGAIKRP